MLPSFFGGEQPIEEIIRDPIEDLDKETTDSKTLNTAVLDKLVLPATCARRTGRPGQILIASPFLLTLMLTLTARKINKAALNGSNGLISASLFCTYYQFYSILIAIKHFEDAPFTAVRKSHCDAGGVWKQEFFKAQLFVHKNEHGRPDSTLSCLDRGAEARHACPLP